MWKFPRRLFKADDAPDVDDFNETVYEFGAESGRLTDHNCDDALVDTDADRLAHFARDACGVSHEMQHEHETAGVVVVTTGGGWLPVATKTITMRSGWLRITGVLSVYGVGAAGTGLVGSIALRVDGVLIGESLSPMFGVPGVFEAEPSSTFALIRVPEGTHTVELVIREPNQTGISLENATITLVGLEK